MPSRRQILAAIAGASFSTVAGRGRPRACEEVRRAAIVIGLDYRRHHDGRLPPLRAAVSGAREFADFLRAQGFLVSEFLDERAPVEADTIYEETTRLVQGPSLDQLLIYFSGHGVLLHDSECWLLSGAPEHPHEAVDLESSVRSARGLAIPSVVFISDACRTLPRDLRANRVRGRSLFAVPRLRAYPGPAIDRFLATAVGDPAYELPVVESASRHVALFTSTLLDACRQPEPRLLRRVGSCLVVSNRSLKRYLEHEVPRRAQLRHPSLSQYPEIICEGDDDAHFARAMASNPGETARPTDVFPPSSPAESAPTNSELRGSLLQKAVDLKLRNLGLAVFGRDIDDAAEPLLKNTFELAGLGEEIRALVETIARTKLPAFEGMIVVVHGGVARSIAASPVHELSIAVRKDTKEPWLLHKRGHRREGASILVELEDSAGIVVPFVVGSVLHLFMRDKIPYHLIYEPAASPASQQMPFSDKSREFSATLAVAKARGAFALEGPFSQRVEKGLGLVQLLRASAPDPALFVSTGHALSAAGLFDELDKLEFDAHERLGYSLLDLLLLRGKLPSRWKEQRWFPFLPMMARSWALMAAFGIEPPAPLDAIRAHLRPSIWTTLEPEGVAIVRDAMREGIVL